MAVLRPEKLSDGMRPLHGCPGDVWECVTMFSACGGEHELVTRNGHRAMPQLRALAFGLLALCLPGILVSAAAAESAAPRPPNVILILLDDAGWRDTGFAGNHYIETPHIDALAARGARFGTAYATHPFCSPT